RLQAPSHDRVIARVNEYLEIFLYQLLGRLQGCDRVGKERLGVGEAFELDPAGARIVEVAEQLAGQPGVANGVLGAEAASGIRQVVMPLRLRLFEIVASLLVDRAPASNRHGRDLAAAGLEAVTHQLIAGVLAGAGNEPALKPELADYERLIGWWLRFW